MGFLGILFIAMVVLLVGGGGFALYSGLTGKSCDMYGEKMNVETTYDIWAGCFVKEADGSVVPQDIHKTVMGNKLEINMTKSDG